ncbi:unnamed protein product [Amoebophrya sp. A120]|nr:unnamed protein product [Amoebophrya sp. A120]|eukprot:GSA120T00025382001.1
MMATGVGGGAGGVISNAACSPLTNKNLSYNQNVALNGYTNSPGAMNQDNQSAAKSRYYANKSSLQQMASLIAESRNKLLAKTDIQHCLRELGICKRHNWFLWDEAERILEQVGETNSKLAFLPFLALFQRLKELSKRMLMDIFDSYSSSPNREESKILTMSEVSRLLTDIGLAPRTKSEQDQMKAILSDSDVDSSGEIDFLEFQGLYARVILEFEFGQQEQMLYEARQLGFTDEDHVLELKEIFDIIDTDHSGNLDITEVREVIGKLYHIAAGQSFLTSECLWGLFHSLDLHPLKDQIDFPNFLRMIRCIESGHPEFAHLKAIFGVGEDFLESGIGLLSLASAEDGSATGDDTDATLTKGGKNGAGDQGTNGSAIGRRRTEGVGFPGRSGTQQEANETSSSESDFMSSPVGR